MSDQAHSIVAAVYPSQEQAQVTIDMLERMHKAVTITLKDAAIITKNDEGKIEIHETDDISGGGGAIRGAVIGGVFGLIFPPSLLVSGLLGGALGGLLGRFIDRGIENDEIKKLGETLNPGQAAVIALVSEESLMATQGALRGYEGTLVVQKVSDDVIKKAFEADASNQSASGDSPSFG